MEEKLYEISTELNLIYKEIAEAGGEVTPEQEARLKDLEPKRAKKLENCGLWLKNLEADAERIGLEIERLQQRLQTKKRQYEGFLDYVARQMTPGENFHHPLVDLKWSHSHPVIVSPHVTEADIKYWPERFIRKKESYNPNRIALKEAIDAGEEVPEGVVLGDVYKLRLDRGRKDADQRET